MNGINSNEVTFERIKASVRIETVAAWLGINVVRRGKDFFAKCPFPDHAEKTGSFTLGGKRADQFFCFGCLDQNELIWTQKGLKKIGDVDLFDKVLDIQGNWQRILAVVPKIAGEVLDISTAAFQNDALRLTPDHILTFVKRSDVLKYLPYIGSRSDEYLFRMKFYGRAKNLKRISRLRNKLEIRQDAASNLQVGDFLLFPVIPTENRNDAPLVNSEFIEKRPHRLNGHRVSQLPVNEQTAWLYGLWLAEGSSGARSVRWTFSIKEKDYAHRISEILDSEFNLKSSIHIIPQHNTCEVICSKSDLADQFRYWFGSGAAGKKIPVQVLNWTVSCQKALLEGYRNGDGDKTGRTKTVSRELAFGLFALAVQCRENIFLNKFAGGNRNGVTRRDYWSLSLRQGESIGGFYEIIGESEYYFSPVKRIDSVSGAFNVVDITVEGSETFCTKLGAVHNCGRYGDLFDLCSLVLSLSKYESLIWIAERCGYSVKKTSQPSGENQAAIPLPVKTSAIETIAPEPDYYDENLYHEVYLALVENLALDNYGLTEIKRRALNEKVFEFVGYRNLPSEKSIRTEIATRIAEKFKLGDARRVPGFFLLDSGQWTFAGNRDGNRKVFFKWQDRRVTLQIPGLIFPSFNSRGKIQYLKIRNPEFPYHKIGLSPETVAEWKSTSDHRFESLSESLKYYPPKYQVISSVGRTGGCSAKLNTHFSRMSSFSFSKFILTEGELKGDSAASLLDFPVAAIAGVNLHQDKIISQVLKTEIEPIQPEQNAVQPKIKSLADLYSETSYNYDRKSFPELLEKIPADSILLAFDRDGSEAVEHSLNKFRLYREQLGDKFNYNLFYLFWNENEAKGFDDLLLSDNCFSCLPFEDIWC